MPRKKEKERFPSLVALPSTIKALKEQSLLEGRSQGEIVEEALIEYWSRRKSQVITIE